MKKRTKNEQLSFICFLAHNVVHVISYTISAKVLPVQEKSLWMPSLCAFQMWDRTF